MGRLLCKLRWRHDVAWCGVHPFGWGLCRNRQLRYASNQRVMQHPGLCTSANLSVERPRSDGRLWQRPTKLVVGHGRGLLLARGADGVAAKFRWLPAVRRWSRQHGLRPYLPVILIGKAKPLQFALEGLFHVRTRQCADEEKHLRP